MKGAVTRFPEAGTCLKFPEIAWEPAWLEQSRRGWECWNLSGVSMCVHMCMPALGSTCSKCRAWLGKLPQRANSKYFRFMGHPVSLAGIQLCCYSVKAAIDKR